MIQRRVPKYQQQSQSSQDAVQEAPKYPRPKILLIDLEKGAETALKDRGYNVATGSFGKPYKTEKSDEFWPVIVNGALPPHFNEQEIVVIDLVPTSVVENVGGEKHISPGENDWWASCSQGVIDPRPRLMAEVQDDFERILSHGGVFIIFAAPRRQQKLILGSIYGGQLIESDKIAYNNWSFLSTLDRFETKADRGEEIAVTTTDATIGNCLADHSKNASFSCTLRPKWEREKEPWFVLATNKYEAPVAGAIVLGVFQMS